MQKNTYGLLGIGLVAVIVGFGLYWTAVEPKVETPEAGVSAPVSGGPAAPQAPQADAARPAAGASVTADKPQPAPADAGKPAQAGQPQTGAASGQKHATPSFDILRVEPDGSVVIAGQALPNSDIEIVAGSRVLGTAKAGSNGDFAVVLDEPLKPGDHQLVLRATGADKQVATSAQTAIVSVPETTDGRVLALVEEPGQASRLITKPDMPPAPQAGEGGATQTPTDGKAPQAKPEQEAPIAIEAVEIEGQAVFVAGKARGGNRVIVHANDILLGASSISPDGRFLVQSKQPLAVGDYIIRADLLDSANGIIATARVPFRREEGENISAVAPDTNGQSADTSADGSRAPGAAPLQKVEGSVIIRRGDNLWTISKRTYGKGTRYTTIYLANRDQIRNPDLIWPGQVFNMPKEPLAEDEVRRRMEKPSN
ncbi:LysM peptidoglycan-binding domain-containing protein [Ochrobactrum sp. CM-21-5]|nr:Ig-like domain-containing protein [Ochrobactrum sp. CM-21-5]MBC2884581.1 LysM peptidoglycan-binding domain-containing protein [Ochrobactrum sp. CM-21-5]